MTLFKNSHFSQFRYTKYYISAQPQTDVKLHKHYTEITGNTDNKTTEADELKQ